MIDFMILYEHRARELENDCLIKAELENRGYQVELVNVHELKRLKYITYKKPRCIIVPYLYNDRDLFDVYARVGCIRKIVNLQWEQILSKKWESIGFHIPKENARFATHLCWGRASRDRLKREGVINTKITGPIHMDLLRENLKSFYMSKNAIVKKYNLDSNKKIILYISSFTYATMSRSEVKDMENRISADIDDIRDVMTVSKEKTLDWVRQLLEDRKDIIFIYRPHPAEKHDSALMLLQKEYSNFRVIGDLSVKQWIIVSDKIFTWFSTSVAEVFYSKKTCAILRPVQIPEYLDTEVILHAMMTSSYAQMLQFIDEASYEFPIKKDIIQRYYSVDETSSYIRVCNFLERVLRTNNYDMKESKLHVSRMQIYRKVLIDEIIYRFDLLGKYNTIINDRLKNRLYILKNEKKQFSKEIVSQREINYITKKIKQLIK